MTNTDYVKSMSKMVFLETPGTVKGVMHISRFVIMLCCLSFLHADIVSAYNDVLTVENACAIAMESSPLIKQAEAAMEKTKAGVDMAISAFLPHLDFEIGYTHSNKPPQVFFDKLNQQEFTAYDFDVKRLNDPGYRDNWGAKFVLTQPVFNQGKEYSGYKIAQKSAELADISFDGTAQTLIFMVKQAFSDAVLAEDAVSVLKHALETADKTLSLAKSRYDNGIVLKSDVLSATVHRTETERELIQAENRYLVAMASLNRIMGHSMDMIWQLKRENAVNPPEKKDIAHWISIARNKNPFMLSAKKRVEIARVQKEQAQFKYLPSINLHAIYDNNRNNLAYYGGDDWTVMVSASFNIFNGFGDKAAVAAATAAAKQTEAAAKEAEAKTELEIRQAYYELQNAVRQLDVMRKSVTQAEESLRILSKRYSNGLALVVELLAADTVVKKERLREVSAKADVRLARAKLEWRAGVLEHSRFNSGAPEMTR